MVTYVYHILVKSRQINTIYLLFTFLSTYNISEILETRLSAMVP